MVGDCLDTLGKDGIEFLGLLRLKSFQTNYSEENSAGLTHVLHLTDCIVYFLRTDIRTALETLERSTFGDGHLGRVLSVF